MIDGWGSFGPQPTKSAALPDEDVHDRRDCSRVTDQVEGRLAVLGHPRRTERVGLGVIPASVDRAAPDDVVIGFAVDAAGRRGSGVVAGVQLHRGQLTAGDRLDVWRHRQLVAGGGRQSGGRQAQGHSEDRHNETELR